jgi:hypothetical protein
MSAPGGKADIGASLSGCPDASGRASNAAKESSDTRQCLGLIREGANGHSIPDQHPESQ